MSERAEHKGWQARGNAIADFLYRAGGDETAWTPEQRSEHQRLLQSVDEAADRHDAVREKPTKA